MSKGLASFNLITEMKTSTCCAGLPCTGRDGCQLTIDIDNGFMVPLDDQKPEHQKTEEGNMTAVAEDSNKRNKSTRRGKKLCVPSANLLIQIKSNLIVSRLIFLHIHARYPIS